MDFVKKAMSGGSDNKNAQTTQDTQQQGGQSAQGAQGTQQQGGQDYLDKGIDFVSKKAGYNVNAQQNEQIGDGLRKGYESYSGKKVDSKYSN